MFEIFITAFTVTFIFTFAFLLGRFSQSTISRQERQDMWKNVKLKVTGKKDDVQIISPSQKSETEEFMKEIPNE